jgi:thiamine transport system permease protein
VKIIRFTCWLLFGASLLGFLAIPLCALASHAPAMRLLFSSEILRVVKFTAWQALVSTLGASAIGIPFGLWTSRVTGRTQNFVYSILAAPFVVPALIAALTWVHLLSRRGLLAPLDWAYSVKALILAHIFFNVPWVALHTALARNQISRSQLEAAQTLGATRHQRFKWIIWPQLKWPVLNVIAQVFNFCVMSFVLVILLGGGPPVETLETSIFASIRLDGFDLHSASAFAFWEICLNITPWILILISKNKARHFELKLEPDVTPISRKERWIFFACTCFWLAPYFIPILAMNLKSISTPGVEKELLRSSVVSIQIATTSAVVSIVTACAWLYCIRDTKMKWLRTCIESMVNLPACLSVFVLGLGFFWGYSRWINPFEGSLLAIVALQSTLFLPLAFRWLWPVALQSQREQLDAALALGASEIAAFFAIEWPRWRIALVAVSALIFASALGEVGAVSLFYNEATIPLPLLITRLTQQYRFEAAETIGALLSLMSLTSIVAVSFFSLAKRGGRICRRKVFMISK